MAANTAIYGVLGENIDYSLSPAIFRALFERYRVDAVYNRFDLKADQLKHFLRAVKILPVAGFNVTIPYKEAMSSQVERADQIARATGSVNLVLNDRGKLLGFNTDYAGIAATIEKQLHCVVRGADVTLIGSGGAARTAFYYLVRNHAASVRVAHRSAARRKSFSQWAAGLTGKTDYIPAAFAQMRSHFPECDLAINCTPVPISEVVAKDQLNLIPYVFELRYAGKSKSRRNSVSGETMLAVQAAENFRIMTGIRISVEEVMKILKKARP